MPDDDNPLLVDPRDVERIVAKIRPLLGGKPPELQGAVLGDLVSIFITGHHPLIREEILRQHMQLVRDLIEPNEKILFPDGKPPGWEAS